MTSSVLGKRSRVVLEQEEVASVQLPRKRITRRSTPQIFEDTQSVSVATNQNVVSRKRTTARASTSQSCAVKPKAQKHLCDASNDIEILNAPDFLSGADGENCPPAGTVFSTPSTNRFKNALAGTPSTPKHRVRATGGLLTPRTPRSVDVIKSRGQNVYAQARQLFTQSATPTKLVGRDTERQQLRDFISNARAGNSGGCTYISGPPGTGKSALVHEVLQDFENDAATQISVVNCVSLRTATQVYGKILQDLLPSSILVKSSQESQLRRLFTGKCGKKTHVVMLDEIDSLVNEECEILYNIFEWALHPSSSLSLIGIANALDLTDRFLPRLKAKGLKPQLLPFLPYTAPQISTIISDKLRTLLPKGTTAAADWTPCMHPNAIQLCGKKIASQTGDLRKAFNLVRRAIDQAEKDALSKLAQSSPSKQPLGEVTNSTTQVVLFPQTSTIQISFVAETAPRATIAHVAKLASSIFNNGTISRLSGLNLQQKAVLCSVISKEIRRQERDPFTTPTKNTSKSPTVAELFAKYTSLCKRDDGILQPLKDTEFRDVVASLETLGLVHESKARSSSLLTPSSSSRSSRNNDQRQIVSAIVEKEMRESLIGPGSDLLRRLLDEF